MNNKDNSNDNSKDNSTNKKAKRIIALISIILLASLYLLTLILALAGASIYNNLFSICLLGTIVVPIFAFVVIYIIDRAAGRRSPGDPYSDEEAVPYLSDDKE